MAATDVATTAALLVRAYEDGDLRGPDERCESHRRLLLTTVLVFLLSMVLAVRGSVTVDNPGPLHTVGCERLRAVLRVVNAYITDDFAINKINNQPLVLRTPNPGGWGLDVVDRHRAVCVGSFHST